jgi:alpha-amylase
MNRGQVLRRILIVAILSGVLACSGGSKDEPQGTPPSAVEKQGAGQQPRAADTKPAFNGLRLHFKRTAEWGEPLIYLFEQIGARTEEYSGQWPGNPMQPEGNGWYVYSAPNLGPARVIFSDGNSQIPKPLWPEATFERQKGEWWYDGAWHDANPEPQPPAAEKPKPAP